MRNTVRETWITGVGIVSSLGEGPDAHWRALGAGKVKIETTASELSDRRAGPASSIFYENPHLIHRDPLSKNAVQAVGDGRLHRPVIKIIDWIQRPTFVA
jgi:3-oxoacyl-(acyl-carrier-protein) synthase